MPDGVDIEPAELRRLANQHDQVAADIRAWAEPPHDWLRAFPHTYGKVAHPVEKALYNYYGARERTGYALADQHTNTANALRQAALDLENTDLDGRIALERSADPFGPGSGTGDRPVAPAPLPANPGAPEPITGGDERVPVPIGGGGPAEAPPVITGPGGTPESPAVPGAPPAAPVPGVPVEPGMPVSPGAPGMPVTPGMPLVAGGPAAPGVDMPGGGAPRTAPLGVEGGLPASVAAPSVHDAPPAIGTPLPGAAAASAMPGEPATNTGAVPVMPMLSPFAAAVAAARDRDAGTAHVVNAVVDEDLLLARTLLAAVLAAVDTPAVGLAWAVSVMRGPGGIGVFITSNEGRGWLAPGLYLPREVSTPWLWDELLGGDGASPWEGVSDPARILAEFGLAWGPRADAALSALASSGSIDASLRAALPDVAMADLVGPAYDVDLRVHTPDTADRLGVAASIPALERAAAVPDSSIRGHRVELAVQAHAQVARAGVAPPEAAAARVLRDRILQAVRSGQPVPRRLWSDLRDADDLLAASMLSRRVDVGRVDLGGLRVDDGPEVLRAMVFERRCNELALLLAEEPTRQSLRDSVYAHEQIAGHPRFAVLPAAVSGTTLEQMAPANTPQGAVSPPVVSGPPPGVTVAPSGAVPTATPERS
ncbi:type VII secretion target [Nocardia sp. NPDC003693]